LLPHGIVYWSTFAQPAGYSGSRFYLLLQKVKVTRWGIVKALGVSVLILGAILYVIIPGIPWLASVFELIFVNGFGLPFIQVLFFM
jgi:hypothetical protein